MSDLVVASFRNEDSADQVLNKLNALREEYLIDLEDACVVVREADGKLRLKQAINLVGFGALSGATWGSLFGTLIGILFGAVRAGAQSQRRQGVARTDALWWHDPAHVAVQRPGGTPEGRTARHERRRKRMKLLVALPFLRAGAGSAWAPTT